MVADDCCVRCCGFCVLQILFRRVLSLPLTLKISQTCSLVYTVNIRKITTPLLQQIRYTFCQTLRTKRDKTELLAPETTQRHKAENIWKDGLPQEKKIRKRVQQYRHRESPKCYPPINMIIVYLRGTLLLEKMSSSKRGVDSRWASLKLGRLYLYFLRDIGRTFFFLSCLPGRLQQ